MNQRTPETWQEGAMVVIDQCEMFPPANGRVTTELSYEQLYDADAWVSLAQKAWTELNAVRTAFRPTQMVRFLARKQHDYGARNVLKFGHDGLKVRLWDKVARLANLQAKSSDSNQRVPWFESECDTLIDMIGYVVIDQMLRRGYFELPLDES